MPFNPVDDFFDIAPEEGVFLVKLARNAITQYLQNSVIIKPPKNTPEKLKRKSGVFVTLNLVGKDGKKNLRGCIGYPEPVLPLANATIDSAINAAVEDPRFPPLTIDELDKVVIEVSVLTPLQLIRVSKPEEYPKNVNVGVDGLVVEYRWNKGLLLPQVPVEYGWNSEEFLSHCCIKAGLPPDYWLLPETKIFKFTCIIAEELEPNGRIVVRNLWKNSSVAKN
ncbi:MAG: TIGR00296 family protein [Candidatus Bathyarchaeota archaeon]|nr:TIGR00296 family protein [Candidatus Bathyarchaeota archaeon]